MGDAPAKVRREIVTCSRPYQCGGSSLEYSKPETSIQPSQKALQSMHAVH